MVGTTRVEDGDVITGHVDLSKLKVDVSITYDATVYFAGVLSHVSVLSTGVIDVRDTQEPETQIIRCNCHDFNSLLEECVVDTLEEYANQTDEEVIDDIFAKYVTDIDFATFVDGGAVTFKAISFENITVRQVMDQIVARTGYEWYIDYSKKLHYAEVEDNAPLWHLSDVPDQVDSFSYLDPIRKEVDATNLVNMVFVVSADSADWFTDEVSREDYGDHKVIVRDARLSLEESIEERAAILLAKFSQPVTTYTVKTYKDGLRAGMNVRLVCAFQDIDETLLINRLKIKFPVDGDPIYELTCGGLESSPGGAARRLTLDQVHNASLPLTPGQLPVGSRGWAHDLEFSASDADTVAWTAGTITTANGQTFAIAAGNTDDPGAMADVSYVYLDLTISETELQITTDSAATVGTFGRILLAVCAPAGDATEAMYQVFGGGAGTIALFTADNIAANTLTANEIAANTITATEINVAQLSAISANMGTLTAGTIQTAAAGNNRVVINIADGIRGIDAADVVQFQLDPSDGKAYAGAGAVTLDSDGVTIAAGAADVNKLKFIYTGGVDTASIWSLGVNDWPILYLKTIKATVAAKGSRLSLDAEAFAGLDDAQLSLRSEYTGVAGRIQLKVGANVGINVYETYITVNEDLRVLKGLYVGADVNPDEDDIWCDGEISTDGGSTKWNLRGAYAAVPTCDRYLRVEVDGVWYHIMAELE